MSDQSFEDKYFDSILNHVLIDLEEEDINESEELYLEMKNTPVFSASLRHKWHMSKLLKSYKKHNSHKNVYPVSRIAVIATLITIIIFSTGVFASANIFKIFQWLGFYTEEYIDLSLSQGYTKRIVDETASWKHGKIYVPSLFPEGYELQEILVLNNRLTINYANDNEDFLRYSMVVLGNDSLISADNNKSFSKKIKIKDYDALYVENESVKVLSYNSNEYLFTIESNVLDENELIKIAENLETLETVVAK